MSEENSRYVPVAVGKLPKCLLQGFPHLSFCHKKYPKEQIARSEIAVHKVAGYHPAGVGKEVQIFTLYRNSHSISK